MKVDEAKIKELITGFNGKDGILIPLLQKIQSIYGYVPKEAIDIVARELSVFPVQIYGILTFYTQFYLTPRGKHTIKVCQGTACHVMGGKEILDYLKDTLQVKEGETTSDGLFSLERVACLGCCGMAPVIMIDDAFYGRVTMGQMPELLSKYQKEG